MFSSRKSAPATAKWDELTLSRSPALPQLDNMKTQLDLVLVALEAAVGVGSDAMLAAAKELNLETVVTDRVNLWRLRQANPQRKGSGGRKKLDIEEARALVLIACQLARRENTRLRQMVADWERSDIESRSPQQIPHIADYIDKFVELYRQRMEEVPEIGTDAIAEAARLLLVELLFYSSTHGHQRLWNALLARSL
jgi:hypothetical protein